MTFDLRMHVVRLLEDEPFFAALSRHINKNPSYHISTAGVSVNPKSGRFEMLFNPDFCSSLTDAELKLLLMHEFYHLVFEHVTERLPDEGLTPTWNMAADAAINGEIFPKSPTDDIKNLFDMAVLPEKLDLPRGHSAEWYFNAIREMQEQEKKELNSTPTEGFDDHDGWSEEGSLPEGIKELAKQRLKSAMIEASQEATSKNWGSISNSIRKDIIDRLTSKVDWRKVLRYFIKTSQRTNKMSSVKRINRRYPYIHAGRKAHRTSKIAISIDQSGSVSDLMLAAFYTELNKLADIAEFTVIPFDTEVAEEYVHIWKKGERRKCERVRSGGTCFQAPTKWVNERNFDGHIILTDMCAEKPISSKCQRMWMTDKDSAKNPCFETNERVIAIEY